MTRTSTTSEGFQEYRLASGANGTALTTTAALISLLPGTDWYRLVPRNFVTAVVARWILNPYLIIFLTQDLMASDPGWSGIIELSDELQDGDTTAVITFGGMNTSANGDYIFVGSHLPFRGVAVDIGTVNSVTNTLTVEYWNGSSWPSISATDGTTSGGATFAVDGNVTWTIPGAWQSGNLHDAMNTRYSGGVHSPSYFWTRWSVSAQLTAGTTVLQMRPLNRATTYDELVTGDNNHSAQVYFGPGGHSTIEALTDAGTGNLLVSVATRGSFR